MGLCFRLSQEGPPRGMFYLSAKGGQGAMMSPRSTTSAPPKSDQVSLESQVQIDHSAGVQEETFAGCGQVMVS